MEIKELDIRKSIRDKNCHQCKKEIKERDIYLHIILIDNGKYVNLAICKSCFKKIFSSEQIKKIIDFDDLINNYTLLQNQKQHIENQGAIDKLLNELGKL